METKETMKKETPQSLVEFMISVIAQLKAKKKYAAVHTCTSTKNSFTAFARQEVVTKEDSLTKRALTVQQANILIAADFKLLPEGVRCAHFYSSGLEYGVNGGPIHRGGFHRDIFYTTRN